MLRKSCLSILALVAVLMFVPVVAFAEIPEFIRPSFAQKGFGAPIKTMELVRNKGKVWLVTLEGAKESFQIKETDLINRQDTYLTNELNDASYHRAIRKDDAPVINVSARALAPAKPSSGLFFSNVVPVAAKPMESMPDFMVRGNPDPASCAELGQAERAELASRYGADIVQFVHGLLLPLHKSQDQMTKFKQVMSNSSSSRWALAQENRWRARHGYDREWRFSDEERRAASQLLAAQAVHIYSDSINEGIKQEQAFLSDPSSPLSPSEYEMVKQSVKSYPVEPLVRTVTEISCSKSDAKLLGCRMRQTLLDVLVQMSPRITCHCGDKAKCRDYRLEKRYQVHYILLPAGKRLWLIDVRTWDMHLMETISEGITPIPPNRALTLPLNI